MYYVHYESSTGQVLGFRPAQGLIYDTLQPTPYITITDTQYADFFNKSQRMKVENGVLVDMPENLDDIKAAKLSELDQAAAAAYVAGFYSSASGTQMYYDSDTETQKLLESIYNRTKETDWTTKVRYPNIAPAGKAPVRARPTATDPESAKEIQLLDAAQIKTLIDDLGDAIFAVKSHLWKKQAEVQAASDAAAVETITW